jgi:uncharacterized protein YraI
VGRALTALGLAATLAVGMAAGSATLPGLEPSAVRAQEVATFAVGQTVIVNDESVNFRSEPGLGSAVTALLPAGQAATVVAGPSAVDGFNWYQLDINGVTGWSSEEFLSPASGDALAFAVQAPLFPVGSTVVVADGDLNLRSDVGLGAEVVDQLPAGTAATIVAGPTAIDGYTWYQIDANGVVGWGAGEFLALA